MRYTQKLIPILAALALIISSVVLPAQCKCAKKSAATTTAKTLTTGASVKGSSLLFNDVCPITGLPTSAQTPVIQSGARLISLCCNACAPSFQALTSKQKEVFVARYTGKNIRTSFPAAKVGVLNNTSKKSCCKDKVAAKTEQCTNCDKTKAPTAKKSCCKDKVAAKTEQCTDCDKTKAPTAKKSCCKDKVVAKTVK